MKSDFKVKLNWILNNVNAIVTSAQKRIQRHIQTQNMRCSYSFLIFVFLFVAWILNEPTTTNTLIWAMNFLQTTPDTFFFIYSSKNI